MIATLFLVACLDTGCLNVEVPSPGYDVAGEINAPISMPFTYAACLGAVGQNAAREFQRQHPVYAKWRFGGWKCRIGSKPGPEEFSA